MLMGQNLEDFLTGINASKQHKSAILKMAAQNMSNGNGGGNGKENYRDKGFATKKGYVENQCAQIPVCPVCPILLGMYAC